MVEWNGDAVETVLHNRAKGIEHVAHWPIVRRDVREVDWREFAGADLVAGGPPCPPFSIGGKGRGDDDHRDRWPQARRSVREIRPRAVVGENGRGRARPKCAGYLQSIVDGLTKPS